MSRLPIRARLTAVFALATTIVLAAAGAFVYVQLRDDLDETVSMELVSRMDAATGGAGAPDAEPEEGFTQILDSHGRVVWSSGGVRGAALDTATLGRASRRELLLERRVEGIEGTARVLARPAPGGAVVAGQSLADRDETLDALVASFLVGGPLAVLVASALGYALATAGLRPVERMRRRAAEVSLARDGELLPLPAARDEVRRLGETLNDMIERLRGSFERERRFVADASHELRTPLAVVKTELEAALRSGDVGPGARAALAAAVEETDRLAQLAEDLLVLARAADGRLPVRREAVRLLPLLEGLRERFADRAAERSRRIDVEAAPALEVDADPLRLRQALGNLIDNALRHGEGDVQVTARADDGSVELEVADSGAGFSPELRTRAFERFSRGAYVRPRGGAGLGLAIVRAIAEAHGGTASIGDGACVRIRLPSQARLSAP